MSSKAYIGGHPLIWVINKWVYEDNGEDVPVNGGKIRPCIECGKLLIVNGERIDACLGVLPGVDNACCGHGVSEPYIQFTNGVTLRGFVVEKLNEKK